MKIEVSELIGRPPADVFRFIAVEHVRNHPRWDPKMELEQLTEGAIRVGTVTGGAIPTPARRWRARWRSWNSYPIVPSDGAVEMHSRMTFEPEGRNGTRISGTLDIPSMAEPMDPAPIQLSMRRMKELIEAES
jgi:hypothetical protein